MPLYLRMSFTHFLTSTINKKNLCPFSTGYESSRDKMRRLFGGEVIDRTEEMWGVNAEGEHRGGFKPSGQPGVNRFLNVYV